MWKWTLIVAALIVVGVSVWASVTAAQPVDAAAARRGPIAAYVEEQARTRLPRTYSITMPIAGRIMPIDLAEGDAVSAGQVVARLETADLDTAVDMAGAHARGLEASIVENNDTRLELSTIDELDSFLESVDRSVEAAQAETEASKAREDYRVFDHNRKKEALERSAASVHEVEEAELAEIESRVDYRTDVLTLRALEAIRRGASIWPLQVRQMIDKKALREAVLTQELAEARASLEQARRDRERAEIKSPVDGVILRRAVSSRRVLPAGELLLEVGRLEDLEVEAEVLSQEAVDISPGDRVEIIVPTVRHEPLSGTVSRVEPQGFTKISSLGVEQQRVRVIIAFDRQSLEGFREEGYTLGAGYRVRVRIFTERHENAVVVPRVALFRGAREQWQLFVVRDGRARLADVTIGLRNDQEVEVLTGVEPGERVVVAPESDLRDGARVK
jgi:HlyD family secretion protein